ncbi:MAG: hypothetical protein II784_03205 [Oscillospiraceae bacterium]|nr:hypothetical protein [Oscillospiraceae bacterium]
MERIGIYIALVVVIYITWLLIVYSRLSTQDFKISRRMTTMLEAVKDEGQFLTNLADAIDDYDPAALKDSPIREQIENALAVTDSDKDYAGIVEAAKQLDNACDTLQRVTDGDPTLQGNNSRIRFAYSKLWSFRGDFDMAKSGFNTLIQSYNRRVRFKLYAPVVKLFRYKEVQGFHIPEVKKSSSK